MNAETKANQPLLLEATTSSLDWKDAVRHVGEVQPGTIITGLENSTDLDLFAYNMGSWLRDHNNKIWLNAQEDLDPLLRQGYLQYVSRGYYPIFEPPRTHLTSKGGVVYQEWHRGTHLPSKQLQPKRGQLKNITALWLDDGQESEGPKFLIKRFVAHADLHIPGIGIRGKAAQLMRIGTMIPGEGNLATKIIATYRKLPEDDVDAAVQELISESSALTEALLRDGLTRMRSGGLSGLGKRK